MAQPGTNHNLTAARAQEAYETEAAKILLTPRQRQRLAEDAIAEIEQRYNVRILGVVKTVNGGQQVITWEAAPLPDNEQESG